MIYKILNRGYCLFRSKYTKLRVKNMVFGNLGKNVRILHDFQIGYSENLYLEDDILIGPNCFINCQGEVYIKRGTIFGPNLTIYSINHKYKNTTALPFDDNDILGKVVINENCWIGCNVIILPGVEIGERCVIGAGAVVTKSIPPFSVVGGNPAKVIKEIPVDNYYKLKNDNQIYNYLLINK